MTILEQSKKNPNTLYIIVQDECHWGVGNKPGLASKLLNNSGIQNQSNIYILQVSATPQALMAVKFIPKENIIDWDETLAKKVVEYEISEH